MTFSDTQQQQDSASFVPRPTQSSHLLALTWGDHRRPPAVAVSLEGLTVGRGESPGQFRLSLDDPRASREHARVVRGPTGWMMCDLGSRNGGFVNGVPVLPGEHTTLLDGAVIRVGDSVFIFREGPVVASEHEELEQAFPGCSGVASRVRRALALLVRGEGHVLVLGETGTGKERVARALAREGTQPVVQNCAELGRELSRSELFGHLRGAFTGARVNHAGLVEAADGGVLFLDELGELALDVQGELLRFLEDGSYRPVGSLELRRSQARVVGATNVDLEAAVRAGRFRRDLLARLRASNPPLELPALRDRREDLPGWTLRFAAEAGCAADGPMWSAGALECLLLHPWPENLRELRGLVRALVAAQVAWPIAAEKLPEALRVHRAGLRSRRERPSGPLPILRDPAVDPSREQIEQALRGSQGNMKVAAELLALERRKLYRLCDRLGIPFEAYRGEPVQEE